MLFISPWSLDDHTIPKPNLSCKFWYVLRTITEFRGMIYLFYSNYSKMLQPVGFFSTDPSHVLILAASPCVTVCSWVWHPKNFHFFLLPYILKAHLIEMILTTKLYSLLEKKCAKIKQQEYFLKCKPLLELSLKSVCQPS